VVRRARHRVRRDLGAHGLPHPPAEPGRAIAVPLALGHEPDPGRRPGAHLHADHQDRALRALARRSLRRPRGRGLDRLRAIARPLPEGHSITSYLGRRVPDGSSKDELTYGVLATDAYGERYTWVDARDLLPVLDRWWPGHPATAYVRALPSDRRVVLDWH